MRPHDCSAEGPACNCYLLFCARCVSAYSNSRFVSGASVEGDWLPLSAQECCRLGACLHARWNCKLRCMCMRSKALTTSLIPVPVSAMRKREAAPASSPRVYFVS